MKQCKTCKNWLKKNEYEAEGLCSHLKGVTAVMSPQNETQRAAYDVIDSITDSYKFDLPAIGFKTAESFGCVNHEEQ